MIGRALADVIGGTVIAANPLWLPQLTSGLQLIAIVGGVILIGLRIYLTMREIKSKNNARR